MNELKLPPLPKPTGKRFGTRGIFGIGMVPCEVDSDEFKADQMRAYGLACAAAERERCAYIAESWAQYQHPPTSIGPRIGAAIRKEPPVEA